MLIPDYNQDIPESTIQVAQAAFPKGNPYLTLRDKLGTIFEEKRNEVNDRFANLIAAYLQEAIDGGDIAPIDTEVVSVAWMGAIYNVIIRFRLGRISCG